MEEGWLAHGIIIVEVGVEVEGEKAVSLKAVYFNAEFAEERRENQNQGGEKAVYLSSDVSLNTKYTKFHEVK
jgi:hypothetical protein